MALITIDEQLALNDLFKRVILQNGYNSTTLASYGLGDLLAQIGDSGGAGTVTSITAGTGLSGGTITDSGTIAIDSTVVTLTGAQVLTNKTLTTPIIDSISTPTNSFSHISGRSNSAPAWIFNHTGDFGAANASSFEIRQNDTRYMAVFPQANGATKIQFNDYTGAAVYSIEEHLGGVISYSGSSAPVLQPSGDFAGSIGGPNNRWGTVWASAVNCGASSNLTLGAPGGQDVYFSPGGAIYFFMQAGLFYPNNNQSLLGTPSARWKGTSSYYYENAIGAQLTAATTITPTAAVHHVTGGTTVDTIALTNLGTGNPVIYLVADGGTVTLGTGGNILAGGTITQDKMQMLVYDSGASKWILHQ